MSYKRNVSSVCWDHNCRLCQRRRRRRRRRRYKSRYRRRHYRHHHCEPAYDGTENVKHKLLESIAREELALAHLINAEAEKTQQLAKNIGGPFTPDEVIAFQHSVADVLERVTYKEKLLLKKLRIVMAMHDAVSGADDADERDGIDSNGEQDANDML